jgi:hypothetical protein
MTHNFRSPQTWMQILANLLVFVTLITGVVVIVLYSIDLYRHGKQKHYIGWFSAAGFVLMTIPISVRLIVKHLINWNAPQVQKYVVRIVWMIPLYSVESWLALRFKNAAIYLETLRECYESYVIFCFLYYLIALLGDDHQLAQFKNKLSCKDNEFGKHMWPVNYLCNPWITGAELLQNCKFGVFQYVLIKNLFAIMVFSLKLSGHYSADTLRWDEIYLYQCMVSNLSQIWALYCLVMFYYATLEELAQWRPVGKFLCVKSVVFFTWWQSITIDFLIFITHGRLLNQNGWTVNEVANGIQVSKHGTNCNRFVALTQWMADRTTSYALKCFLLH